MVSKVAADDVGELVCIREVGLGTQVRRVTEVVPEI